MITVFTRDGEVIVPDAIYNLFREETIDWTQFIAKDVDMIVCALLGYPLAGPTQETLDNWLRFRQAVYLLDTAAPMRQLDELLYEVDSLIARFAIDKNAYLTVATTYWSEEIVETEKPIPVSEKKEKPAPSASPSSRRTKSTRSPEAASYSSPVQEPVTERHRRTASPVAKTKPTFAKLQSFMTNGAPRL